MKDGIHPKFEKNSITCSCGHSFTAFSTKVYSHIEVCNKCHPAYTGIQKNVGKADKVTQYNKRFGNRGIGGKKADDVAPAA